MAGGTLFHKKAVIDPTTTEQKTVNVNNHLKYAIAPNTINDITTSHQANQSNQSVRLTECALDVIIRINKGTYQNHISTSQTNGINIEV